LHKLDGRRTPGIITSDLLNFKTNEPISRSKAHVLMHGAKKTAEPGVTSKCFRDTSDGFNLGRRVPLLTTKSFIQNPFIHELLWFFKRITNINQGNAIK